MSDNTGIRSSRDLTAPRGTNVVQRVFVILNTFKHHPVLSLSALASYTGIPKTTVHRIIRDLVDAGALESIDGQYRIGLGLLELGTRRYRPSLREEVFPYLEDLRHLTSGTVHIAVLDRTEVVYVEQLTARGVRSIRLGGRLPALATASGLLLAFGEHDERERVLRLGQKPLTRHTLTDSEALQLEMSAIRERGYAVDVEGVLEGFVSVAVPVRNHLDHITSALTVIGAVGELDRERTATAALAIAQVLHRISRARQIALIF